MRTQCVLQKWRASINPLLSLNFIRFRTRGKPVSGVVYRRTDRDVCDYSTQSASATKSAAEVTEQKRGKRRTVVTKT